MRGAAAGEGALLSSDGLGGWLGATGGSFAPARLYLLAPRARSSAGGDAPVTVASLRAVLREEREVEEISISKATTRRMAALLESAGMVGTLAQAAPAVPPSFAPPIQDFSWAGGEDARSPAASLQLARYLTSVGVPIAEAGPGFKVVDVHRKNILTTQLGRVVLKGRPDAVVIPAEQLPAMAVQQARVIVDFKVESCTFEEVMAQAQGELLAASSLSHHDVLVVCTDLNTFGHVLRAEEDKLLVWSSLTVEQMLFVVASFLNDECAPVIIGEAGDARVPGDEARKRRRFSFLQRAHSLVPKATDLLEQLEVFNTGDWRDYLEGRELVFSAMAGPSPSYIV